MLVEPAGYSNYTAFNNSSELVNSSRPLAYLMKDQFLTVVQTQQNISKKMSTSSFQKDIP